MYKAVIFDLGGVVVPFDFKRGYAAIEPVCPYPAAEIPKRIRSTDLVHRFETGKIGAEAFVAELSRLLDLRVSFDEFCALWTAIFLPDTLIPEALLQGLRARYRLIALSNTNEIHYRHTRAGYPVLRFFDDLVLSFEVGAVKPDLRIYAEAVARAGCAAQECFFIDDVPAYVEAGRRAGMDAIQFESAAQLERELTRRGII